MSRANLDALIPRSLLNRPSRVRHYAIAAVGSIGGNPSTRTMFWCQIPAGFEMDAWKIQPHRGPLCVLCAAHANAIGDTSPTEEDAADG